MTTDKDKIKEALAQARASFHLPPDTVSRHPTKRNAIAIVSPADKLVVSLSVEPTDKQLDRLQDHYETSGDLVNIRTKPSE